MDAKRLQQGFRPINNVVDVTNYVPRRLDKFLHVFDAQKIKGPSIMVRNATENLTITTLDEVKRTRSPTCCNRGCKRLGGCLSMQRGCGR